MKTWLPQTVTCGLLNMTYPPTTLYALIGDHDQGEAHSRNRVRDRGREINVGAGRGAEATWTVLGVKSATRPSSTASTNGINGEATIWRSVSSSEAGEVGMEGKPAKQHARTTTVSAELCDLSPHSSSQVPPQ